MVCPQSNSAGRIFPSTLQNAFKLKKLNMSNWGKKEHILGGKSGNCDGHACILMSNFVQCSLILHHKFPLFMLASPEKCASKMCPIITHSKIWKFFHHTLMRCHFIRNCVMVN